MSQKVSQLNESKNQERLNFFLNGNRIFFELQLSESQATHICKLTFKERIKEGKNL